MVITPDGVYCCYIGVRTVLLGSPYHYNSGATEKLILASVR